jgi:hypothetical protein
MQLIIENIKKIRKYKIKRLGIIPIYLDPKIQDQNNIIISIIYIYLNKKNFIIIDTEEKEKKSKTIIKYLTNEFNFMKIKKKNIFSIGRTGDTEIFIFNLENNKNILKKKHKKEFEWGKYYNLFKDNEKKNLYKSVYPNNEMNTHFDDILISLSKNNKISINMYILIRKLMFILYSSNMKII